MRGTPYLHPDDGTMQNRPARRNSNSNVEGSSPAASKRKSRLKVPQPGHQHDHANGAAISNRSSPEPSPERRRSLRGLTARSNGGSATKNLDDQHNRASASSPSGKMQYKQTPLSEKLAYFGSNESERGDATDDDEGNASSSDDSATDMLDRALGLQHSQDEDATQSGQGRREMLVNRPKPEPHFGYAWEQALLRPKRSTAGLARERSLTPSTNSPSIASRRRPSPSAPRMRNSEVTKLQAGRASPRSATPIPSPGATSSVPFRLDLLPEVCILTASLVLAAYRLAKLPMPLDPYTMEPMSPIPLSPLIMLIMAIPCVSLARRRVFQSNYMFPFTDERGYRSPPTVDDGFAAGSVLPVLLAAGFLWDAVQRGNEPDGGALPDIRPIMDVWQAAGKMPSAQKLLDSPAAIQSSIMVARISLLLSTSINSFILILHIVISRTFIKVDRIPKDNTKRFLGAFLLSSSVSLILWALLALNHAFAWASPYISPSEAAASSLIYQMSMYTISRLVRRGFTLGELSLATGAGISLCLEFWRITLCRLQYAKYGGIPATFRAPTPLLPFQHVMIPGAFLTGFLLSPLLVLSRNFAQMPSHRLKWPEERGRNRKLAALGIFLCLSLIVCLPFGGWAGWQLGGGLATAWIWGARFAIFGGDGVDGMRGEFGGWKRWHRIGLSLYWLAIATAAVGGWQTRLVRARRIRLAKTKNSGAAIETGSTVVNKASLEYVGVSNIREHKRTHVALDLRRKFFHALAVVMFVPAIAIDPAFTSLAFSVAFAIFTFAEYARFFAVFPIGAPIHVFFNEFIDSKDAGPVILSHFYLLTGCAGGLWLEGKGIKQFTGVLAVGIGDAFASVLGRRLGKTKWPNSSKTLLGTFAFIASIFLSAMLLQVFGIVEPFSASKYLLATIMAGLLEAMSLQNDNLIIPIFFWSVLSLLEV